MFAARASLYSNYEDEAEERMLLPSYDVARFFDQTKDLKPPASLRANSSCSTLPDLKSNPEVTVFTRPANRAGDDMAVQNEPSRQVDYLSHDWKEEDISSTWRYIVSKWKVYSNSERLENASWRAWMKAKYRLRTVSPEILEWRKDSDVTWLYGPHHTRPSEFGVPASSLPEDQISEPDRFPIHKPVLKKRPILKKRSPSETLLQRSLNARPVRKQTAAVVHASSANVAASSSSRLSLSRHNSSPLSCLTSSGIHSLGFRDRRQIRFNDEVEQCIAVDLMKVNQDTEDSCVIHNDDDYNDIDAFRDSTTIMQLSLSLTARNDFNKLNSPGSTSRTITTLPPTALKPYKDTYSPQGPVTSPAMTLCESSENSSPSRSRSPSPEILGLPSNFLLGSDDYDDDDMVMDWQTPATFSSRHDSHSLRLNDCQANSFAPRDDCQGRGFELPPYGTSMHYDEDEHALLLQLGCLQA
ncbi:MAG: hypothetical protein M1830_007666 [Pleopsidium flavum]|nr:MAG: hypothetical protein M1830_007666 [Pleopsidium flavum]